MHNGPSYTERRSESQTNYPGMKSQLDQQSRPSKLEQVLQELGITDPDVLNENLQFYRLRFNQSGLGDPESLEPAIVRQHVATFSTMFHAHSVAPYGEHD